MNELVPFHSHRQSNRHHWIDEYHRSAATCGHRIKCPASLDSKIMETHGKHQFAAASPIHRITKTNSLLCSFMNAVLQCLSHTDILAEYFVLDQYKVRFLNSIYIYRPDTE